MIWTWLAAAAAAAPFQTLQPAATLDRQQAVMGGAVGYRAPLDAPGRGPAVFSAWARYGLEDRVEALGGAALSTSGFGTVVHGGLRARALGEAQGPQLSVGGLLFTGLDGVSPFGVSVPVQLGLASASHDLFVGTAPTVVPLGEAGTLWSLESEAGMQVTVASFPAWFALTHATTAGAHAVGLAVGLGYDLSQ